MSGSAPQHSGTFSTRLASATIGSCVPVTTPTLPAWRRFGSSLPQLGTFDAVSTQGGACARTRLVTVSCCSRHFSDVHGYCRYCVADETFVPEAQVTLNPSGERVSAESGRVVEWACEDNYLFQLRKQSPALAQWAGTYPKSADQIQELSDADMLQVDCDGIEDELLLPQNDDTSRSAGWRRRITPAGAAGWVDAALRAKIPCEVVVAGEGSSTPTDMGSAESDRSHGGAGVPEELSVSRPASRVAWGISVPGDTDHTVYVWLDALSNYLTAAMDFDAGNDRRSSTSTCHSEAGPESEMETDGTDNQDLSVLVDQLTLWPPDHQIVGKDILKFHSIYWPAFLVAAGIPLPERLHVHAHWQAHDGAKMSKTSGNVVCPHHLISTYGIEATRYYLLRDGPQGSKDAHFDEEMLITRCNTDLANTLGNLLTRVTAPKMCTEQAWCVHICAASVKIQFLAMPTFVGGLHPSACPPCQSVFP